MFRRKRQLDGRRILITGASSGIGAALARELSEFQPKLLLTARRRDRLDIICSDLRNRQVESILVPGDITSPELRATLLKTAEQEFGGLDIIVNNAGIGGIGTFASADESRLRQIMEVNFFAPFELLRESLPLLEASRDPVVVNVSSVLGHVAVPKKSEYCASKFAVHGMTDALRVELAPRGIDVLLVSPSTTKTEFFDHALRSTGNASENKYAMTSAQVAKATVSAIERRRRETILSAGGRLLVITNRLFPGILSRILGRFA